MRAIADGMPGGAPVRECRSAGAQLSALQAWPAGCVAKPLRRTATGISAEAPCASAGAGRPLSLRRELTGDLHRRFVIEASTTLYDAGATRQLPHRSTITFHYLGPCRSVGTRPSGLRPVPGPASVGEPLPVTLVRVLLPAMLIASFAVLRWFVGHSRRDRRDRGTVAGTATDVAGAATIPVLATFTGVRGLPWWFGIASNNAAPRLVLEPEGVRGRVLRQRRRSFAEIACVDVRQARGMVNLDVAFHGSLFTFAANVGTVALAAHVIASLPPAVPLSPRAKALRTPAR